MSTPIFWWSLAALLVLLELVTGTVYLLMVAIGFAAGGIAAHFGLQDSSQLLIAGLICGAATLGWHSLRSRRKEPAPQADKSVQMDIGETVEVRAWESNGTARVMYRGAEWSVQSSETASVGTLLSTGLHRIIEVRGNTLIVTPTKTFSAAPAETSSTANG
jgi:membrane protein implicated in regulation of membrane protease activity